MVSNAIVSHKAFINICGDVECGHPVKAKPMDNIDEYNKLHKEPPIGDATMDDDGTIRVRLRMMGGMHATGNVSYAKGSEHYDAILKHLGGIRPGEVKLVPPWPDSEE